MLSDLILTPSAAIVVRIFLHEDIRKTGSGNSGATNAFRIRFYLPVKVLAAIVGITALLGHLFSLFIGGKGGKGMATGAGFFSALYPLLFPACLAVFLPLLALSRRMSVASIAAAVSLPFLYLIFLSFNGERAEWHLVALSFLVPVLIIVKHRKNIARLLDGKEKPLF